MLISVEQWEKMRQSNDDGSTFQPAGPPRQPNNRIVMGPARFDDEDDAAGRRE